MISNDLGATALALAAGFTAMAALMLLGLRIAVSHHLLTVVDTMWGLGFILIVGTSAAVAFAGNGEPAIRWLLLAMVATWGGRLAWHLHTRNSKAGEDPRYADLASRSSGSFGQIAFRRVFVPQGISMWLVATPVMVGVNNERLVGWLTGLGIALWAIGLFFESVGDRQLARFKADPANKGRLMDQGLWRYTRHPNYFGDTCIWWGIWLVSASSWAGLASMIGPIAMTIFLTKVTGAALNGKGMSQSKPGYAEYVRRTSGFIPRPPKKL